MNKIMKYITIFNFVKIFTVSVIFVYMANYMISNNLDYFWPAEIVLEKILYFADIIGFMFLTGLIILIFSLLLLRTSSTAFHSKFRSLGYLFCNFSIFTSLTISAPLTAVGVVYAIKGHELAMSYTFMGLLGASAGVLSLYGIPYFYSYLYGVINKPS